VPLPLRCTPLSVQNIVAPEISFQGLIEKSAPAATLHFAIGAKIVAPEISFQGLIFCYD